LEGVFILYISYDDPSKEGRTQNAALETEVLGHKLQTQPSGEGILVVKLQTRKWGGFGGMTTATIFDAVTLRKGAPPRRSSNLSAEQRRSNLESSSESARKQKSFSGIASESNTLFFHVLCHLL